MADSVSMKDTLRLAVLFGFLAAAAIGGCTGMGDMREGEEESRTTLTLEETYDHVRNGARLIIGYDAEANAFTGTVRNVTEGTLSMVRVEVHLSNGTELGPTTPVDLAPGELIDGEPAGHGRAVHRLDRPSGSGRRGRKRTRPGR